MKGFTEEETLILEKITDIHFLYNRLESTHPSDMPNWTDAIHTLQLMLGVRILRREHPEYYATHKNKK